jgi:hypothetical protein
VTAVTLLLAVGVFAAVALGTRHGTDLEEDHRR